MKATAITKQYSFKESGEKEVNEFYTQCNFDQKEVFSWTVVNDEEDKPDHIVLITKNGISMEIVYEDDVLSDLASEFRKRGVL